MSSIDFDWDPDRPTISVADPRMTRMLLREPDRCATLNEYASACGMDTSEVVSLLAPYLDSGTLALDFFGEEVFVNTGPSGRPAPIGSADVPPNLWEQLRTRSGVEGAYGLWKLLRSLERSGWAVEHRPHRIMFGLGQVNELPYLGVRAGQVTLPTLIFPLADALTHHGGLLDQYEYAGASAIGVVCDERGLDSMVTVVRQWVLTRRVTPRLSVLVMEAPRYNPTLLSAADAAVLPVSVTRDTLSNYIW